MSRWLWGLLALSAVAVAVALAIAGPGGSGGRSSYANTIGPHAYIDKDIYDGEGPCDPEHVATATTEYVGDSHKLAVCIGGLDYPQPVGSFQLVIGYDDELDECRDVPCEDEDCLDDNPDANAGDTTWPTDGTTRGLGEYWTCSGAFDLQGAFTSSGIVVPSEPYCDQGQAWIACEGGETFTLGDDESWGALAVLDLDVVAAGTDVVSIESLAVWDDEEYLIGSCGGVDAVGFTTARTVGDGMDCDGATDIKKPPRRRTTPTPTLTATPTEVAPTPTSPPPTATLAPAPTATPFGRPGGIVIAPPPTGSGSSGEGFPWTLAASLLAGTAGAAAAGGGLYLRFAKGSRREGSG